MAIYAVISGFFGCALLFIRSLTIQDLRSIPPLDRSIENDSKEDIRLNKPQVPSSVSSTNSAYLASLLGLFNFIIGIGNVVVPFAAGSLVDAFTSIDIAFLFQGCCHLSCVLGLGLALFLSHFEMQK